MATRILATFILLTACGAPASTGTSPAAESEPPTDERDAECERRCVTPHGSVLGEADRVVAYSNCSERCIDETPFMADVGLEEPVYTGIRFQCVEYARRYWLLQRGVVFGSVDTADSMWTEVREATSPSGDPSMTVIPVANGAAAPPAIGDLVIYAADRSTTRLRFGHVAVVVRVDTERGRILVAEQNLANATWAEVSHARELGMRTNGDRTTLMDRDLPEARIYGWLHLVDDASRSSASPSREMKALSERR